MLIDSHCHIDFDELAPVAPLLARCQALGIDAVVVPGVSLEHLQRPLALAKAFSMVWPSAGFHPWYLPEDKAALGVLTALAVANKDKLVAIGEAGLDKFKGPDAATQQWWLEQQLQLAIDLDKPVILHSVGRHARLVEILKQYRGIRGVIHAFSGSAEQALAFVKLGFYLGVGGVITKAGAHKTRNAIKAVPSQHLMLETDAPAMLPEGVAGEYNSPENLPFIHKALSEMLQIDEKALAQILTANTQRLFCGRETG
ncbi:TatD family hydrolase [Gallaecimonas mangrovi]|uniref:TatD family hydrolase n=1 Tax=Gallaecimonas mangrovi TaxID=2291597 RepID=UPI000E2010E2|nr:TatD family hydrolase [Gallaecimonas mangrovi]